MSEILNPRNLINVGVFAAVYFVVTFAANMVGFISPVAMLFGWALGTLINGVVSMLYLAKDPHLGAFTLLGLIVGALMVLTGHVWFTVLLTPALGFFADLVFRAGRYTTAWANGLGYAVFSMWHLVPISPVFFDSAGYREYVAGSMGEDYADEFMKVFTFSTVGIASAAVFVIAFFAAIVGMRVLSKHFKRAGVV